jgi:N-acetylmuramoyl-L-alanine amidase
MNILSSPSPNFNDRPKDQSVDMLVLHYTGMKTGKAALERMCDPAFEVSAHFMVDIDGTIHQLVSEEKRAWHAGVSYWRGNTNINDRSIGIEIVNPGHEWGYEPFPIVQMESVISLCQDILSRHSIEARNIVGHSDIAPSRKMDPGELFDWNWLAQEGIGLASFEGDATPDNLSEFGYDVSDWEKALIAFRRRFDPLSFS